MKFIELNCYSSKGFFIIEVIDFGIGIKQEDIKNIFIPFQRGQNVETIQGTGLGLAIVKESVNKHNGTIKVESQTGKGTKFIISLSLNSENSKNE